MSNIIQSGITKQISIGKGEHIVAGADATHTGKLSEALAGKGLAYYKGEERRVVTLRESAEIFRAIDKRFWSEEGPHLDYLQDAPGLLGWLDRVAKALPK